jgi:hypothetical protein
MPQQASPLVTLGGGRGALYASGTPFAVPSPAGLIAFTPVSAGSGKSKQTLLKRLVSSCE